MLRRVAITLAVTLPVAAALTSGARQEPTEAEGPHDAWLARLARDSRSVQLEDVSNLGCAECHRTITEEWRLSTHATAWQDERYQKELRKVRRKDRCTGCHAPEPLVAAGFPQVPETREDDPHLGVTCVTCHTNVDGETILGPFGVETDAHPTAKSEHFTGDRNDLCISCHATTIGPVIGIAQDFVDSKQEELDLSCIECHMPRLTGPIANDAAGGEYPDRPRRSHRINTPRDPLFLARAFDLSAARHDGKAVLTIANATGHRVPGTTRRELTFEVRLIDRHGDEVAKASHLIDHRRFLPVDEVVEVELEEDGTRLEVRAFHETEGMRRRQLFLERSLELE